MFPIRPIGRKAIQLMRIAQAQLLFQIRAMRLNGFDAAIELGRNFTGT